MLRADALGGLVVEILRRCSMQIKDVMTRNVEVIAPDATLEEAAGKRRRATRFGSDSPCGLRGGRRGDRATSSAS
jgi:CBS domain-containing protein